MRLEVAVLSSADLSQRSFHFSPMKVKSFSRVWLFAIPWTVVYQASLSMGFSRQEYWSGLPFPSPGGSSWPRDRTQVSCITGRFFAVRATRGAPIMVTTCVWNPQDHSGLVHKRTHRTLTCCIDTQVSSINTWYWSIIDQVDQASSQQRGKCRRWNWRNAAQVSKCLLPVRISK